MLTPFNYYEISIFYNLILDFNSFNKYRFNFVPKKLNMRNLYNLVVLLLATFTMQAQTLTIAEARAKAQFRTDKVVRPEIFVDANVVKGMGGGGGVGVEFAIPNKKKGPEFGVRVGAGVVNMDLGSGGQRQGTDNTELKDNERMRVNEVRLEVGFVLHIPRT